MAGQRFYASAGAAFCMYSYLLNCDTFFFPKYSKQILSKYLLNVPILKHICTTKMVTETTWSFESDQCTNLFQSNIMAQ